MATTPDPLDELINNYNALKTERANLEKQMETFVPVQQRHASIVSQIAGVRANIAKTAAESLPAAG